MILHDGLYGGAQRLQIKEYGLMIKKVWIKQSNVGTFTFAIQLLEQPDVALAILIIAKGKYCRLYGLNVGE